MILEDLIVTKSVISGFMTLGKIIVFLNYQFPPLWDGDK